MSFVRSCIEECLPIWKQCLESPFLARMEADTLEEECFKGYIIDDSLYLREYAKVFAWGMTKAKTLAEIKNYYSLMSFVNSGEGNTRIKYLKKWGLDDASIQHLPLRKQNADYVQTMLTEAQNGSGAPECMMAVLPCVISYSWIFKQMVARTPSVLEGKYADMVKDYVDPGYDVVCDEWIDFTDSVCEGLSEQQLEHCRDIFKKCSQHELNFWTMSNRAREDV